MNKEIAKLLKKKGAAECIKKSELLANDTSKDLHLRNLGLDEKDMVDILKVIEQEKNQVHLKSISFSYNPLIGDAGATLIANKLPSSIYEIGLVDCGIGDKGGAEILKWMRKSDNLQMICMEQNKFSDQFKKEFNIYKLKNPKVMVIY